MNVTDEMRAAARDAFEAQCRLAEARAEYMEVRKTWVVAVQKVEAAQRAYAEACFRQDDLINRVAGVPSEGPYR